MLVRNGCKVVVSCALIPAAIAVGSAQTARSNSTNEALACNGDGAQLSNQIHWPDGFHLAPRAWNFHPDFTVPPTTS